MGGIAAMHRLSNRFCLYTSKNPIVFIHNAFEMSLWRSQGCRSRVEVVDPNYIDLQLSKGSQGNELLSNYIRKVE